MSNIADKYYEDVITSNDPAYELLAIYCDFLGISTSLSLKRMFNKLIKLYGVKRTFIALLILLSREQVSKMGTNRVNFYLQGILSNRLKEELDEYGSGSSKDLQELAEENHKFLVSKPSLNFRSEDE